MSAQNNHINRKIRNSDDVIEMHVDVHCALIAAAGREPTDLDRDTCRRALRALVQLARNEYALNLALDMEQVATALKD